MCFLILQHGFVQAELNPLLRTSLKYDQVMVERVLSTDTLLLASGEKVALIGLTGLDPLGSKEVQRDEHGFIIRDQDPTTSFEVEALRFMNTLVGNKMVRLEFDVERRDEQGHLLAYVILPDGKIVNEEALRYGFAHLKLRMPNMKYAERFRRAYKEARQEMRGLQGNW